MCRGSSCTKERMSIKDTLKANSKILSSYYFFHSIKEFVSFDIVTLWKSTVWFFDDLRAYKSGLRQNPKAAKIGVLMPELKDRTTTTPLDPIYFLQDSWAAKKIFELKPEHHYDVGSAAKTIGIISQFVPTTMIDIRPIEIKLNDLFFREGSILALPFPDGSIQSLSSLCVIEHIGLGRYGDPVDVSGSEKAAAELQRVTAPGGIILISVPVDDGDKVYFNAHRVFTPKYVMDMFNECTLLEQKYIYGNDLLEAYDKNKGYVVGLFMFKKF